MDNAEVLSHIDRLLKVEPEYTTWGSVGFVSEVKAFIRAVAGKGSSFEEAIEENTRSGPTGQASDNAFFVKDILKGYRRFVESGLQNAISPARQAQLGVTSDFLGQAEALLDDTNTHPAAAAVVIGAALEEFLRNWSDSLGLSISAPKPGLDAYAKALVADSKLDKQDMKDITSWGGIRNDAAHGFWPKVADRERVRLMLAGVNLFMRKYGAP